MASKIEISFNEIVVSGQHVTFSRGVYKDPNTVIAEQEMIETFVATSRRGANKISTNGQLEISGIDAAREFEKYFKLDHDIGSMFSIMRNGKLVIIEFTQRYSNYSFFGFSSTASTGSIHNDVNHEPIFTGIYNLSQNSDNACDKFNMNISSNQLIEAFYANGQGGPLIEPTQDLELTGLDRGLQWSIAIHNQANGLGSIKTFNLFVRKVIAQNVNINIVNNPTSGATVTITPTFPNQPPSTINLNLTYSLNGIDYSSDNILTGQADGNYTIYIKDFLGCVTTVNYTVNNQVPQGEDIFYISNANSIPFSDNEVWGVDGVAKNDENTLSLSSLNRINYREDILINRDDRPITIQIKSSYAHHNVRLQESCADIQNFIPIVQRSNNMNRFANMDSKMYKYAEGLTGLYFMGGNTYDEQNVVSGQYVLNGNLPDFAIEGEFIEVFQGGISIGIYEIINVLYDHNIDKRVIVFNYNYNSAFHTNVRVASTYNLLNFEIWEFTIDFSNYPKDNYRIKVTAIDEIFGTRDKYSENIYLQEKHEDTVAIEYWEKNNRDVFYAYNIKHFIRLRYLFISALIDDSTEITRGDNSSMQTMSELYDGNTFVFDATSRETFLRNCIAMSCPYLFINNIGYIKKGNLKYENYEGTNQYELSVDLLKTNNRRNDNTTQLSQGVYIPTLGTGSGIVGL